MIVRPSEKWLAHSADPEKFGTAIMLCKGYSPDCSHHGRCLGNGDCFRTAGLVDTMAARRIVAAAYQVDDGEGAISRAMLEAAEWLRTRSKGEKT